VVVVCPLATDHDVVHLAGRSADQMRRFALENIGDRKCRVLIGFNNGVYETIDLSQWMARNPLDVLATNFSKPASLFQKLPRRDVFIASKDGPEEANGQP
jgi:hypothetical protein